MSSVDANSGCFFFIYGYGGTGKTFIWRAISAEIRSRGEIVLKIASSGIAALLILDLAYHTNIREFYLPYQAR
jgi:ATP-dependent DNA helicase PIF1